MNEGPALTDVFAPVRKQINVSLPVETAFELFTDRMGRWWPLDTHSVGLSLTRTCIFEGRVGGRIYEIMQDGRQADWGRVLTWELNRRIVFSWHPGRAAETAQQVSITFTPNANGTLVELTHTGWEALGDVARKTRESYQTGWDYVLASYVGAAMA